MSFFWYQGTPCKFSQFQINLYSSEFSPDVDR